MNEIKIPPQTPNSAQKTAEFNRQARQFEREEQEARAAYIDRNSITPEEEYKLNYYPYHAFTDI